MAISLKYIKIPNSIVLIVIKILEILRFWVQNILGHPVLRAREIFNWVMVVLRSPIHANQDNNLYSVVEYSVGCAVEHIIVFTWLICMNGTSQYHHYLKLPPAISPELNKCPGSNPVENVQGSVLNVKGSVQIIKCSVNKI